MFGPNNAVLGLLQVVVSHGPASSKDSGDAFASPNTGRPALGTI